MKDLKIDPPGGNLSDSIYSVDRSDSIGVCVKKPSGQVVSQSPACKIVCGNQVGYCCNNECMAEIQQSLDDEGPRKGTHFFHKLKLHNHFCDIVVINDKNKDVILFYPLDQQIKANLEYFRKFGLTDQESNIVGLVLNGFTNSEIAKQLHIARSTLKTHLNNIYKKIPGHYKALGR